MKHAHKLFLCSTQLFFLLSNKISSKILFLNTLFFVVCVLSGLLATKKISDHQHSPTEAYLNLLDTKRTRAYEKIHRVLSAPDPSIFKLSHQEQVKRKRNRAYHLTINPLEYHDLIESVITREKEYSEDYYVLYNGNDKALMFLHLFMTYLYQRENNWSRDDFFIMRSPSDFYDQPAKTAQDFIQQHLPSSPLCPKIDNKPVDIRKQFISTARGSVQFDMAPAVRKFLVSTSPAFVAGVDATPIPMRWLTEQDLPAWESSFYYFMTNLSWVDFDRVCSLISQKIADYTDLFSDQQNKLVVIQQAERYILLRLQLLKEFLFPKKIYHSSDNRLARKEDALRFKAGIMYQIFIPKTIIDDVAYLSWQNGIVWQRKINNVASGWSDELGAYTKVSPLLEIFRTHPERFGRAAHLFQVRLVFKDLQYLFSPESPIKMHLITTLAPSLMRSIQDILRSLAQFVYEYKEAALKNEQELWAERVNLVQELSRLEAHTDNDLAIWAEKRFK